MNEQTDGTTGLTQASRRPLRFSLTVSLHGEGHRDDSFIADLNGLAEHIYDINFSCRALPFEQDAQGAVIDSAQSRRHLADMLYVQEQTGITVSAEFDNVYTPPTHDNLRIFVEGLKPLYEAGVRSITQPHTLWMKWGSIQREFPELRIKNTIFRKTRCGRDFWNFAEAGFDCVTVDRILCRNQKALRQIDHARRTFDERFGKRVTLCMASSSGCLGPCPFLDEQRQHTLTHPDLDALDDQDVLEALPHKESCLETGQTELQMVFPPPFRDDFNEVTRHIDVIRLGDPLTGAFLAADLDLIREIVQNGAPILLGVLPAGVREAFRLHPNLPDTAMSALENWRDVTRNCNYQCWDCDACKELAQELARCGEA